MKRSADGAWRFEEKGNTAVLHSHAEVTAEESEGLARQIDISLRELPDTIDQVLYTHGRWPVVVDRGGKGDHGAWAPHSPQGRAHVRAPPCPPSRTCAATMFLKYQRGAFLFANISFDVQPEKLRQVCKARARDAARP